MNQQKKLAGNAADKRSHSRWRKLWNAEMMRGARLRKRLLTKIIRRMGKSGEVHNGCSCRKAEGRAKDFWTVS
ncbi:hypothetical protein C806_00752 [Lachnospiraceae bacterium 3-1]|nr:hypothetical protein C806_00752 [Lachnospiraceae bacterium 3-1]